MPSLSAPTTRHRVFPQSGGVNSPPLPGRHYGCSSTQPAIQSSGPHYRAPRSEPMSKYLRYAGIAASAILIVFGVASIVIGAAGRNTVRDNLSAERIVGTPDMTPKAIKAEAATAGLKNVDLPTCSVAGNAIDNGTDAR